MRAVARILLLAAVPALVGLALVAFVLPRPPKTDRLAARILGRVERTPLRGAVIDVDGSRIPVACQERGYSSVLAIRGHSHIVVRGARVIAVTEQHTPARGRSLQGVVRRLVEAEMPAALADLAGPRGLYEKELVGRLQSGEPTLQGVTRFLGVRSYRVRLGGDRPRVVLYASVATLRPLGVSYTSRRIDGTSLLLRARRHGC